MGKDEQAPKRQSTYRVDSAEVMGEGSYVVLRPIKYGRARELIGVNEKSDPIVAEQKMGEIVSEAIADWNWVDDEGNLLKLPKDGLDLGDLYSHEIRFLIDAILLRSSQQKN